METDHRCRGVVGLVSHVSVSGGSKTEIRDSRREEEGVGAHALVRSEDTTKEDTVDLCALWQLG